MKRGGYQRLRRASQLAFALLYLGLPLANAAGFRAVLGTLGSTRLGPVDLLEPASALSALLASGFTAPLGTLLVGVAPAVLLTLLLGPFFCSWVCPFGLVSELADRVVVPWRRPFRRGAHERLRVPRIAFLGLLLLASALLAIPAASILHGPRAISTVALEGFYLGTVSPFAAGVLGALLLADLLLPRRLFCRALCPAGSLANFLRTRRTLRVAFDPVRCHCVSRRACLAACRWGLDPRKAGRWDGCTNCLDCVDACESGALSPSTRAPSSLVRIGFPYPAAPGLVRLGPPRALPTAPPATGTEARAPTHPPRGPLPGGPAAAHAPRATPVPPGAGAVRITAAPPGEPAHRFAGALALGPERPEGEAGLAGPPHDRLASIGMRLSTMLHDLKSPLTVISTYAQLMASEECPNERQKSLSLLLDHFTRINAMTREVLDYASGRTGLIRRKVYLNLFVDGLAEQLRHELERRGIELRLRAAYRGVWRFDELKVRRAIVNVARNAAEAMEDGGRFTIRVTRRGDRLVIWMRDTGPGVPEEILPRLFQPFATHGKETGTGLGLAVVKRVAEEHGGTITCRSRAGRGATFVLSIPDGD